MLRLDHDFALPYLDGDSELSSLRQDAADAHRTLVEGTGPGSRFTGWRALLENPDRKLLDEIMETARSVRKRADVFLCIGIGGSYLGARAVIQALTPYMDDRGGPEILFAGHHMSGAYMRELLDYLDGKSVVVNVISKSGTTLEPALAFRFIRRWMEEAFDDVDDRIIVTTDPDQGALNVLRGQRGYRKFEIPPSVGGRFSVLTPVGLLPIAVAGIDIRALVEGAVQAFGLYGSPDAGQDNAALDYAALRFGLLRRGFAVEILSVFEARLLGVAQWWQQLFGESEGKEGTGLFPTIAQYSTDLHSFGQYVQDGQRTLIETFLMVEDDNGNLEVPESDSDLDGLNYLSGKSMRSINRGAYEGTAQAHFDGGVPNMTLWMDRLSPETVGAAIYFFEHAVSVGGYMLGINPFDQPGVEAYKNEMFSRLGKPSTVPGARG